MKSFQYITIVIGSLAILIIAYTGNDVWKTAKANSGEQEYYAVDPNNPDGEPIHLNGELTSYAYDFPTQNGEDYSKDAISEMIIKNIRSGSELVLGVLYERLGYLETQDGNLLKAKIAYASALDFYVRDNQKLREAEVLSKLAHLEVFEKNYASAKDYYHKSADLYAQLNEPVRSDYTQKVADRLPLD